MEFRVVVRHTILQLKTPDEIRGRVLSANSIFINSSNELGQFESGAMAKFWGNSFCSYWRKLNNVGSHFCGNKSQRIARNGILKTELLRLLL